VGQTRFRRSRPAGIRLGGHRSRPTLRRCRRARRRAGWVRSRYGCRARRRSSSATPCFGPAPASFGCARSHGHSPRAVQLDSAHCSPGSRTYHFSTCSSPTAGWYWTTEYLNISQCECSVRTSGRAFSQWTRNGCDDESRRYGMSLPANRYRQSPPSDLNRKPLHYKLIICRSFVVDTGL
jgi:hypothetical protein